MCPCVLGQVWSVGAHTFGKQVATWRRIGANLRMQLCLIYTFVTTIHVLFADREQNVVRAGTLHDGVGQSVAVSAPPPNKQQKKYLILIIVLADRHDYRHIG